MPEFESGGGTVLMLNLINHFGWPEPLS